MKKIFFFAAAALLLQSGLTNAQSCCPKPGDMCLLALNADFKASHEAPEPFTYAPEHGKMLSLPVKDGADANVFYIPAKEQTNKILLVFHEWWGLNDYIKREAESLQKSLGNVEVYAVDLYDGKVATSADEASKLMSGLDPKRGSAIIQAVLNKVGKDKKIATIGWCMGGSWSFNGTLLAGNEAAGCVMYYGFPEEDAKKIKPLKADVLYVWGSLDQFITKDKVSKLQDEVKATKHKFTWYTYEANHAFANPSNPKYDVKAATEAHEHAVKFLKEKLDLK